MSTLTEGKPLASGLAPIPMLEDVLVFSWYKFYKKTIEMIFENEKHL
jgi:hypothetical protein